ncbi:glucose 1-dehydrogenase [Bacillus sp. S3]|uniref:SDR family NAD(P)-dependent oxidoreductase n=1 Tax=Bacillus sp. S3 TaxID=486398 RepID=UPI00118CB05C|nr:glucose 1-dehydrogenase [Bacillus sp. S3]QCJ44683.1 glucose 1-dehydrogenase [Bacillus sp. S3]
MEITKAMDFSNKVAIITGGRAGVGRGIANRFAQAGANVVITYSSEAVAENAQNVAKEIEAMGVKSQAVYLDQRDIVQCKFMVEKVVEEFGKVDILVNNAGIYPHHNSLTIEESEWDNMLDSNLKGTFYCCQAAGNQMIDQGNGGSIINIISINAFRPMANGLAYGASKAGLAMVTRCLATDLGKYGIRVNGVAPGLIDAPGLDQAVPGWREKYNDRAPLGRIGNPEDIGDACLFLSSPLSSWITGQVLTVDGGITLAEAY